MSHNDELPTAGAEAVERIDSLWIVFSPAGVPQPQTCGFTHDDAMQVCFGHRERDRYPHDWWQHNFDAGWTCREIALRPASGAIAGLAEVDFDKIRNAYSQGVVDYYRWAEGDTDWDSAHNAGLSEISERISCSFAAALRPAAGPADGLAGLISEVCDDHDLMGQAKAIGGIEASTKATGRAEASRVRLERAVAALAAENTQLRARLPGPAGAASGVVPADHVVVPREPTPEMLEPFARLLCAAKGIDPDEPAGPDFPKWYGQCGPLAECFEAMFAAAPNAPPAAARGPERVGVPADLVALSEAAPSGLWSASRDRGDGFADLDSEGTYTGKRVKVDRDVPWSAFARFAVTLDGKPSPEGRAALDFAAAAVNFVRSLIAETARPSRAEGDGGRG